MAQQRPTTTAAASCCPPKPKLGDRELLSSDQAGELAGLFKLLGNDTRVRLLHALVKSGELCVTELAEAVEMKPQAVSNQLQRLVDRRVLGARRSGNNIYYQVVDPCVTSLLDYGLCLVEDSEGRLAEGNGSGRVGAASELRS
ncbi:MAG: helix-turn-helix transcriptional regulator [Myxococcales bacterium]|nr:helix-turn-helix transcriptional regulator [Myxococcales bacterium]MCB9609477.1 helix-turn-helix transcriptional regulator [Polyangiaceae bacterium]